MSTRITKRLHKQPVPKPESETAGAVRSTSEVATEILNVLRDQLKPVEAPPKPKRKLNLTTEQRAKRAENLAKARQMKIEKKMKNQ